MYKDVNFDGYEHDVWQTRFEVKKHEIKTIREKRVVLSPWDSKRLVDKNMIDTYPIGYK